MCVFFFVVARVLWAAQLAVTDCICYCCNKRHNSCWTIWISTYNAYFLYFCIFGIFDIRTGQTDTFICVWAQTNLISRILARTVIENCSFNSPNQSPLPEKYRETAKQTSRLTLETLGFGFCIFLVEVFTDLLAWLAAFLSGYVTLREISNVIILTVW